MRPCRDQQALTVFLQRILAIRAQHDRSLGWLTASSEEAMNAMDLVGLLLILFLVVPLVTARPSRY